MFLGAALVVLYGVLLLIVGGAGEQPSCAKTIALIATAAVVLDLVIAAFVYGIVIARRNPSMAALVLSSAIVFLVPATNCTVSLVGATKACK